jgi:homoserine O-acetyltransferase
LSLAPQHENLTGAESEAASAEAISGVLQLPGRLSLHHGGSLDQPSLAWRLAGKPGAPVVVALGGISAHRRVFDTEQPRAGWWCEIAGPGRALDSTRLRILGIDYLGGSGESTAPTPGGVFPSLSSYDQAEALLQLLDHLQLARLRAIVGASYGGMVALAFAERHAARVQQLLVISAADRAHPMSTAWRSVQRRVLRFALASGHGADGMELARALAMATYRSPDEFAARFSDAPRQIDGRFVFPVEEYLFARGRDYAARYRPESFLCLSESIDLHAIDAARVATPTTLVAVREDQLVPIGDMRALAERLPDARLHELSSLHGHDTFLKDAAALQPAFATLYGDVT